MGLTLALNEWYISFPRLYDLKYILNKTYLDEQNKIDEQEKVPKRILTEKNEDINETQFIYIRT